MSICTACRDGFLFTLRTYGIIPSWFSHQSVNSYSPRACKRQRALSTRSILSESVHLAQARMRGSLGRARACRSHGHFNPGTHSSPHLVPLLAHSMRPVVPVSLHIAAPIVYVLSWGRHSQLRFHLHSVQRRSRVESHHLGPQPAAAGYGSPHNHQSLEETGSLPGEFSKCSNGHHR